MCQGGVNRPGGFLTWRASLILVGAEGGGFRNRWEGGSGDVGVDKSFRNLDEKEGAKGVLAGKGWRGMNWEMRTYKHLLWSSAPRRVGCREQGQGRCRPEFCQLQGLHPHWVWV